MEITKLPDKILGKKLEQAPVDEIKKGSYRNLISDMKKAMIDFQGVGLAGNQIGKDIAVFVIDEHLAEEAGIPDVYFNPEITEYAKESDEMEEGCLSIPGYFIPIKRSKKIKIKFINDRGEKMKLRVRGFPARVLQHETDHLNGLTIRNRK